MGDKRDQTLKRKRRIRRPPGRPGPQGAPGAEIRCSRRWPPARSPPGAALPSSPCGVIAKRIPERQHY